MKKPITNDIFYPRTLALIGISATTLGWAYTFSRFQGKVYGVNPHPQEILNLEIYPSLLDIPDEIDQAIVMVPNKIVPQVLEDCGRKGVKVVTVFTSGFSEIQTREGRRLQEKVKETAERFGIILVGPNCVGLHNSRTGLNFTMERLRLHEGKVAFISQSGGLAQNFTTVGRRYGVDVLKAVSCGNSALYEPADFLDFFKDDPEIELITLYVEGARDGRKLLKSLAEANRKKPVIIWKSGRTAEGSRAAGSHTGALTGTASVWETAIKQSRAVMVNGFLDLVYTAMTFNFARIKGRNLGIVGISGGQSVEYTDIFHSAGLRIPLFSRETQRKVAAIMPKFGVNTRNPLDISAGWSSLEMIDHCLKLLNAEKNINGIVVSIDAHREKVLEFLEENRIKKLTDTITSLRGSINIPLFVILTATDMEEIALTIFDELVQAKIPVYRDPAVAASCIKKLSDYSLGAARRG